MNLEFVVFKLIPGMLLIGLTTAGVIAAYLQVMN